MLLDLGEAPAGGPEGRPLGPVRGDTGARLRRRSRMASTTRSHCTGRTVGGWSASTMPIRWPRQKRGEPQDHRHPPVKPGDRRTIPMTIKERRNTMRSVNIQRPTSLSRRRKHIRKQQRRSDMQRQIQEIEIHHPNTRHPLMPSPRSTSMHIRRKRSLIQPRLVKKATQAVQASHLHMGTLALQTPRL